jgi:hypothetical protein
MATLVGVIRFVGSVSGIRNFKKLYDPKIYASEKGFISKKLYKTSPKFKNNRLSNDEFGGCALAVKEIRRGLIHVVPEMVDAAFTARLMKFTRALSLRDDEHEKGKRSLCFSKYRSELHRLEFNKNHKAYNAAMFALSGSHSDARTATTIEVSGLKMRLIVPPSGATHYRIMSHMSVVSDYCYSETLRKYGPTNPLDALSAFGYSEIVELSSEFTAQIHVAFPEGTILDDDCTVIHCIAIEFLEPNGKAGFRTIYGASMEIMDVF